MNRGLRLVVGDCRLRVLLKLHDAAPGTLIFGQDPDAQLVDTPAPLLRPDCQIDDFLGAEQAFDCGASNLRVVRLNLPCFEHKAML